VGGLECGPRRVAIEWADATWNPVTGAPSLAPDDFVNSMRALRERVMFGKSVHWAILSGLLALPDFTVGKAVLVVWFYAIAGACRLRGGATQVLPDCRQSQLGILFWPARTIGRCFIVA